MLVEVLRRPSPGELGGGAVVHAHALLVHEAMLRVVAIKFERLAGVLHRLLELVDEIRRAPIIGVGEMRLQRNPNVGGLPRLLRRNAEEYDPGRELRNLGGADDGDRAAEAEAGKANLGAVARQILRGAA